MIELRGLAHFSIAVSDLQRSKRFYVDILGCTFISSPPDGSLAFLDAGGDCVVLVKQPAPIHSKPPGGSDGVHHAFMIDEEQYEAAKAHLEANGIPIIFEEDRANGAVTGPRFYFRDPDGTPLELIYRTAYNI